MLINFVRIIKNSIKNFARNLWLSLATLSIIILALSLAGGLILLQASADLIIDDTRKKADLTLAFQRDAEEADVLTIREKLEQRPEIRSVIYSSPEEVLERQKEKGEVIRRSIEAVEGSVGNPYGATIQINLYDTDLFPEVQQYIDDIPNIELLLAGETRARNEELIQRINDITNEVSVGILIFIGTLGVFVFLVIYNTIRLAIYTARDEIHIMKLVGASNWFVRGPFIVSGIFYAVFAALFSTGLLVLLVWQIDQHISSLRDLELYAYMMQHLVYLFLILLGIGLVLSVVSSYIAIRRYLRA